MQGDFDLIIKKSQFLIKTPSKVDFFAEIIFLKIIYPIRVHTGCSAQRISRIFQWLAFIYYVGAAAWWHNTAITFVVIVICFLLYYQHRKLHNKLLPLSSMELTNIDLALLRKAIDSARTRVSSMYFNIGFIIFFSFGSTGKYNNIPIILFFLIPFYIINYFEDVAMTCGGEQKKVAREKKVSILTLLKLNVGHVQG